MVPRALCAQQTGAVSDEAGEGGDKREGERGRLSYIENSRLLNKKLLAVC